MGIKSQTTDNLFKAMLSLKNVDECYEFFEDLCTVKEILDISQRFDVALMLDQKKNYQQIAENSGASTATISRVNKCYAYGSGGYKKIIDRLKDEKNANR